MQFRHRQHQRTGAVLPLVAICLIALLAMIALAIDIGIIAIARNQCQNAADASALAGCRTINGNPNDNYNFDNVPGATIQAAKNNLIMRDTLEGDPNVDWDNLSAEAKAEQHPSDHIYKTGQIQVEVGSYTYVYNDANPSEEGFKLSFPRSNPAEPYSAVKSTITYNGGFAFASIFGNTGFSTGATATAIHRPRDVVIIMDLSGSMRFQSLPARSYSGSRSVSLNPDPDFPKFGHYQDTGSAGLYGNTSVQTGSGEYYDPANLTIETNSGPPIMDYFFQNHEFEKPDPNSNRAFTRAPSSYSTNPGGDNYLKENRNKGSDYARTLYDIVGEDDVENANFERDGYDYYYAKEGKTFQGYTYGPSYWGKTFFIWPPDPRGADPAKNANNTSHHADNGAKDWRQRFFFKVRRDRSEGSNLDWLDHNNLFWMSDYYCRPQAPDHYECEEWCRENDGNSYEYNFRINYAAILKWLDSDPKPFPPRLRAGRIKYYDGFPNYNDTSLNQRWWNTDTNSLPDLNERFWKGYIDFVLGLEWRDSVNRYSIRNNNSLWSGTYIQSMIGNGDPYYWGSWQINQKPTSFRDGRIRNSSGYDKGYTGYINVDNLSSGSSVNNGHYVMFSGDTTKYRITARQSQSYGYRIRLDTPLQKDLANNQFLSFYDTYPAYIDNRDNPRRPKHHLWFGPMTLVDYLGNYNNNHFWWPGNVPEAQAWSCKIGIQTAIDDIKNNHPNDFVAMTFFSDPRYSRTDAGQHNQAVVPLGRNYQQLKDSLWFPPSTVTGGVNEITPWDSDFDQVPRAKGGTAPGMGFMIAYNLFSSSTSNLRFYAQPQPQYRGVVGGLGRKGASRIIIFESDGAPNTRATASMGGSGKESYYRIRVKRPNNHSSSDNVEFPSGGSYSDSDVFDVVRQICASENANPPGYSSSRKPVQIYCIGYGTLFDPANASDSDQIRALNFFQTIQYYGNTANNTNGSDFPVEQRIYGTSAQRIQRMQSAFERILQGGVQVSLIE